MSLSLSAQPHEYTPDHQPSGHANFSRISDDTIIVVRRGDKETKIKVPKGVAIRSIEIPDDPTAAVKFITDPIERPKMSFALAPHSHQPSGHINVTPDELRTDALRREIREVENLKAALAAEKANVTPGMSPDAPTTTFIATDGGCSKNGKANCVASAAFVVMTNKDICALRDKITAGMKSKAIKQAIADFVRVERSCKVETGVGLPAATNNRGELTAIRMALEYIEAEKIGGRIVWVSDSEYSQKSVDIWCRKWRKNPADAEGKLNLDLIYPINERIDALRKSQVFDLVHVRSHKVMPEDIQSDAWMYWVLNDYADKCCQRELSA